jgi:hypothetical protein
LNDPNIPQPEAASIRPATLYMLELTQDELADLMRLFVAAYVENSGTLAPSEISIMMKLKRLKDGM